MDKSFQARLRELLKLHEGVIPRVYRDTLGIPTVGVGFNLERADSRGIIEALGADFDMLYSGADELTPLQTDRLLDVTLCEAANDAAELFEGFATLDPVRRMVLTDMAFNLGRWRLARFRRMRAAVREHDWKAAGRSMRRSLWYRQVGSRGRRLVRMMLTGDYPTDVPSTTENNGGISHA